MPLGFVCRYLRNGRDYRREKQRGKRNVRSTADADAAFHGGVSRSDPAPKELSVSGEEAERLAERLLKNYGDSILRLAYIYLHNRSDAEDVLRETLLRSLQAAPKFENAAHEKAWLLRVSANLSKNKIKYNRIRETDELQEELAAEKREDLAFVWEAVRELPDHYREVIHLYYQEGYSAAAIAAVLGKKESTVRSDLRRGRERLKRILKEDYDFE